MARESDLPKTGLLRFIIGKITPTGAQEALRFAREFIRRVEEKIRERER
jgi:hypothetical protein